MLLRCVLASFNRSLHIHQVTRASNYLYNWSHFYSTPVAKKDGTDADSNLIEKRRHAKMTLNQAFQSLSAKMKTPAMKPIYSTVRDEMSQNMWRSTLTVQWPDNISCNAVGKTKKEAEELAALEVVRKLENQQVLSEKGKLLFDCSDQNSSPSSISTQNYRIGPVMSEDVQIAVEELMTIQKQFNDCKSTLLNCFVKVANHTKDPNLILKPSFIRLRCADKFLWKATYNIKWPEPMSFSGVGHTRAEAEKWAILLTLRWLLKNGSLHWKGYPVLYSKQQLADFWKTANGPVPIQLPNDLASELENLLRSFGNVERLLVEDEKKCQDQLALQCELAERHVDGLECDPEEAVRNDSNQTLTVSDVDLNRDCSDMEYIDPVTGYKRRRMSSTDLAKRNRFLYSNWKQRVQDGVGNPAPLPIKEKRQAILDVIDRNRVVVLSGDTGCGKSTQLPQFLLDSFAEMNRGAECNIIVTQPRRLAAISLAQAVARDRGEHVGQSVGYQVRLKSMLPTQRGGVVLFCSVGILLRRLQTTPNLSGLSHLIIDEVHERDVLTDSLLIIVKDLLRTNPSLKVILMSASLNAQLLSRYFNDAPLFHVSGRAFPVRRHYGPEVVNLLQSEPGLLPRNFEMVISERPLVDLDLTSRLIRYIDANNGPEGAILCFLPGWQDIKQLYHKLKESFPSEATHWIIPVHSRLSSKEQERIFDKPPPGVRKVVLATNIAETSLTVNDVVYVIDPGVHKELRYNSNRGTTIMENQWISKANVEQRAGRAGRVQSGKSFHLYSEEQMKEFSQYPEPEILRVPLEKVIVDIKAYNENLPAAEFLSRALEPPSAEAVQEALEELRGIGVLDDEERLTPLGRRIVHFSTHPRLAKALAFSTLFGCVDPVASIVASLSSSREAWDIGLDQKEQVRRSKREFHPTSDHLALAELMSRFEQLTYKRDVDALCDQTGTNPKALHFLKGVKNLLLGHLYDSRLLDDPQNGTDRSHNCNALLENEEMVKMVLLIGFGDRILRVRRARVSKGAIISDQEIVNGRKETVTLLGDTVNASRDVDSDHLIFFNGIYLPERKTFGVRESSQVSPLTVLLASQSLVHANHDSGNDQILLTIDGQNHLKFSCSSRDAELLLELRHHLDRTCQYLLRSIGLRPVDDITSSVIAYHTRLVTLVSKLLRVSGSQSVSSNP